MSKIHFIKVVVRIFIEVLNEYLVNGYHHRKFVVLQSLLDIVIFSFLSDTKLF